MSIRMWELVLSLGERQSNFTEYVHSDAQSWLLSIHVNMLKFWPEANNNYKKRYEAQQKQNLILFWS